MYKWYLCLLRHSEGWLYALGGQAFGKVEMRRSRKYLDYNFFRNRWQMEKTKSNINQSIRLLSKNKLNASSSNLKSMKTSEGSLNKHKSKKTSLKNIFKTGYLVKRNDKAHNDSSMYKTSLCTPADTTALMSCISTPNSRSQDKRNLMKKVQRCQVDPVKFHRKENDRNGEGDIIIEGGIKITFSMQKILILQKYFDVHQSLEDLKRLLIKEVQKKEEKTKAYYGMVGFYTKQANIGLDKMLKNLTITLKQFKQKGISQLNLNILLAKKEPNYLNLEFSNFKLIKYLGSGGFSSVYLARCMVDGTLCALKFIKKSSIVSENKYKMLENEKNILFTIDHCRLVDLYYALESKNYIIFGLEYCPNGNLYQLIQRKKSITESEAKFVFSQILEGLSSLHSQKILFRDVKLQNILFDQNGNVKITDFGLSKPEIDQEDITYSYCGSPEYMAPEMLAKTGHSFQIDHYALGILLYELLYGHSPFFAPKKQDIFHAIMNSEPHFPKNCPLSKEVKSLIKGLLQKNPKHRIGSLKGVQQIISHPWLRGYSTVGMVSPFLKPYSEQNIEIHHEDLKAVQNDFAEDLKTVVKQKLFFGKSFVNKFLVQKLEAETIEFKHKVKNQKMKSIQKPKTKAIR